MIKMQMCVAVWTVANSVTDSVSCEFCLQQMYTDHIKSFSPQLLK